MSTWRISAFTGVLAASYFVAAWTKYVWAMFAAPIPAMYEAHNISIVNLFGDKLEFSYMFTMRVGWLLALGRGLTVAFFVVFLVYVFHPRLRRTSGTDEALGIALTLGSIISFGCLIAASYGIQQSALRLHASELLLMLGVGVLLTLEPLWDKSSAATLADQPRRSIDHEPAGSLSSAVFRSQ